MSGQQVVLDFIQEMILDATSNLENMQNEYSEQPNSEETLNNLLQAKVDVAIIQSIKEMFDSEHLTEKRLQDKFKQLRDVNDD